MSLVRVKICCIVSIAEAHLAIRHGASALGLVSAMPSGPGPISEELIAEIAATIPPGIASFLLTCEHDIDRIIAQQRRTRVNTIQLCDRLRDGDHQRLRDALPGISIVQVIHVTGSESLDESLASSRHVHALLLDSGNHSLAIKELGGTGRTHDWSVSAQIVEQSPIPVFLAGGLDASNVAQAIGAVRPFGVDVCSKLRTSGQLDEAKLAAFMHAVRSS